jgi:hypothetical protein
MSKNAKQAIKRIHAKNAKLPKRIHIVFTVRSGDIDPEVDQFVDPIGCFDNAGIAAVVMGKVHNRKPIEGLDYGLLNDFENSVVISLPLNSTIRNKNRQ